MWRTITPAVLKIVAAPMAQAMPTAAVELREVARVFMARNCEYGSDVPPPIDSLDLPLFRPRFPWWSADLQTIAVLLGTYQSDLSPHTSERLCFCLADRSGDILVRYARSSRNAEGGGSPWWSSCTALPVARTAPIS